MTNAFDIQETPDVQIDTTDLDAIQSDPNASPFKKFVAVVKKRGRESAKGKDSLPNLVGDVAQAVTNGAFDPKEKQKWAGDEVSMAKYIFYSYAEEEGKKAVHARTEGSVKSQISKIQQVITAAARPEPANFASVLDRALKDVRPKVEASYGSKAMKPAFDAYIKLARMQKDKDTLTDADIESAWLKPVNGDVDSVEKELAKAHRILKKLLGDGTKSGIKIEQTSDIYDDMSKVEDMLKQAIRTIDSEYDVPKPAATPTNAQVTAASNSEDDPNALAPDPFFPPAMQDATGETDQASAPSSV